MLNEVQINSTSSHPFYNLNLTDYKKKQINKKFKELTKESFDAFLFLLKNFNYNYMYCDNVEYWKGKKQLVEIQEITKNPDFSKVYDIWEKQYTDTSKKLSTIELELKSIYKNLS